MRQRLVAAISDDALRVHREVHRQLEVTARELLASIGQGIVHGSEKILRTVEVRATHQLRSLSQGDGVTPSPIIRSAGDLGSGPVHEAIRLLGTPIRMRWTWIRLTAVDIGEIQMAGKESMHTTADEALHLQDLEAEVRDTAGSGACQMSTTSMRKPTVRVKGIVKNGIEMIRVGTCMARTTSRVGREAGGEKTTIAIMTDIATMATVGWAAEIVMVGLEAEMIGTMTVPESSIKGVVP